MINRCSGMSSCFKPINVEAIQSNAMGVSPIPTVLTPDGVAGITKKVENITQHYEKLAKDPEKSSPLEIVDTDLPKFGNEIAIAFSVWGIILGMCSGAEDVSLIDYASLTGQPFRVFSMDTRRLNSERCLDAVVKHYGISIVYMLPEAVAAQLIRNKGLFRFYDDGRQVYCQIRKVKPLRTRKGLPTWITGRRKDNSPGTRANIPVVQVDHSSEGIDGGIDSLVKFNTVANADVLDVWNFLQVMDVPVNTLHSQGCVSVGREPCTRPVFPWQHEREERWWWEDGKAKEHRLRKGNVKLDTAQLNGSLNGVVFHTNGNTTIFNSRNLVSLSRTGIDNLSVLENKNEHWLVVLYASWCSYCQSWQKSRSGEVQGR